MNRKQWLLCKANDIIIGRFNNEENAKGILHAAQEKHGKKNPYYIKEVGYGKNK